MKKYVIWLVGLLFAAGCSTNSDNIESATDGNYIARSGPFVFLAHIINNKCTRVTAFKDNAVFSQTDGITTTGVYPNLTFSGDGFNMVCQFRDADNFTASVAGQMSVLYVGGYIEVSGTYNFARTNEILGVNGDGIIDN